MAPYGIERKGENQYRICMAVAGLGQNDIELTQNGNMLLVSAEASIRKKSRVAPSRHRDPLFQADINLADHVRVTGAQLENGLLSIELVREIPEQLKPRRIEIGSKSSIAPTQDNYPAQIDEGAERKVA